MISYRICVNIIRQPRALLTVNILTVLNMLTWVIAQLRRERFIEDLENYGKQVEEFQTCGDVAEIHKYLKKAQTLDGKLQAASDKVELRIN